MPAAGPGVGGERHHRGYRALLDAKALGLSLIAFISISMDRHTPERFENFDAQVKAMPEVLECSLITGRDADYQLKVIVRDMDAFQELLLHKLTRIEGSAACTRASCCGRWWSAPRCR
jgi:Lrp/AsnC family leucine-responsive transcriptional regulator